jgi:hypothetical protein
MISILIPTGSGTGYSACACFQLKIDALLHLYSTGLLAQRFGLSDDSSFENVRREALLLATQCGDNYLAVYNTAMAFAGEFQSPN